MKRLILLIFCGIAILAMASVAVLNVNFNTNSNNLSNIALMNIEALANRESVVVNVPCSSEETKTCHFIVKDKDGNDYLGSIPDFKNAF